MRIVFTGGGTGGHLFPMVAVARELKKLPQANDTSLEMFYVGPKSYGLETLTQEGIVIKNIISGKIRRYFSLANLISPFQLLIGFIQSLWKLYFLMPDVIFSKGGYGSVPVVLVGWLYRIPILAHESDTIPGLANRLAGKMAKRVAVSFSETTKYFSSKKVALIGHPIRTEICTSQKQQGLQYFNLDGKKPILLVIGGSQGAHMINEIILGVLPLLSGKYDIIHVCGPDNFEAIKNRGLEMPGLFLYPFLSEEQLKMAYATADLIISRAGAGSIYEIAACQKPSILIPLPNSASNHQKFNAFAYAQTGASTMIEQPNLTPNLFVGEIEMHITNEELKQKMSEAARNFSRPQAAAIIAQSLIELTI